MKHYWATTYRKATEPATGSLLRTHGKMMEQMRGQHIRPALAPQKPNILLLLTVSEKSLQEIMKALDISDFADRHPMTLSGGQKQRVIIASAMFCGKKILYFDEPTSGIDFSHMMQTCQLLKQLQKEDVFLFIITHDYELIASICNSVIHIENGRVQKQYLLDETGIVKLQDFFSGCYS